MSEQAFMGHPGTSTGAVVQENFIIDSLTYIPVGACVPVLSRPYVVNATEDAINTIAERVTSTNAGKVTANLVSGVASSIIQPSAVGYQTGVNSGWVGTRKYIFLLKVKTISMTGIEINSYIQGYTDYDGITSTGNIDCDMVHHINNVIETTCMTYPTPLGVIRKEKLYKIYNVFTSTLGGDAFTQRPVDILENIDMLSMANLMSPGDTMQAYSANNLINPYNNNAIASTVNNTITTEYLSKILTTGMLVNKSKDIYIGSYEVAEQDSLDSKIPEPSINDNRFIKYISRLAGFKTTRELFNFNQLMSLDPSIYSRFRLINLNKNYINPQMASTPDVGDHWNGQDPVTLKAHSLIENMVSMSLKYGFSKLFFTATNMATPTGTAEVYVTNFDSFMNLEDMEFTYLLEIFKEKFISEIFLNETLSGAIPLHMEGYVDLLGTTKIRLQYAGYPDNWYTIPTYANSMFQSVVTLDKNALDFTSHQLGSIIATLSGNDTNNRNYY